MKTVKSIAPYINGFTVACSYCAKLIKGQEFWDKEYLDKDELHSLPVSHGICKSCLMINFPNEYLAILYNDCAQKEKIAG